MKQQIINQITERPYSMIKTQSKFSAKKVNVFYTYHNNDEHNNKKHYDQNYKKKIVSKQQPQYTQGNNVLPINFSNSVSEYNKLLITNGKKFRKNKQTIFEPQSLETLNIPIYVKNIQTRQQIIAIQKQKDKKQITTGQNITNCGCCCCDNYCYLCEQEQKISEMTKRKSNCSLSFMKSKKSQNLIQFKQETERININKSQMKRRQKVEKEKKKLANIDPLLQERNKQKYEKVKPLIEKSLKTHLNYLKHQHKLIEEKKYQTPFAKIKRFGDYIRDHMMRNKSQSQNNAVSKVEHKFQWGSNQSRFKQIGKEINKNEKIKQNKSIQKQIKQKDKNQQLKKRSKRFFTNANQKIHQKVEIVCHPKSNLSKKQIYSLKKLHLIEALKQLKKFKQQQQKRKKKIHDNLETVISQQKEIIQKNKKKLFKPTIEEQKKAFIFEPQILNIKSPQNKKSSSLKKQRKKI